MWVLLRRGAFFFPPPAALHSLNKRQRQDYTFAEAIERSPYLV